MTLIPARLRQRVVKRAANRCEYCGLAQIGQEAKFHIDHVIPVAANGPTHIDNLALACVSCSLRKSAKQTHADPQTGERVAVFNPRSDQWPRHFRWNGFVLAGRTAIGRATVDALQMNRALILAIRQEEAERGRHPP